jgi:hypothetical protein
VGQAGQVFTAHRRGLAVPLLSVLGAISLVEAAAVHVVLRAHYPIAAWVVTLVSVSGATWCIATARSLARHPLVVSASGLTMPLGTLWRVFIPSDAIGEVRPPKRRPDRSVPGYVGLVLFGPPTIIVKTSRVIEARGPAGLTRSGTIFGVAPDDPGAFASAVERVLLNPMKSAVHQQETAAID